MLPDAHSRPYAGAAVHAVQLLAERMHKMLQKRPKGTGGVHADAALVTLFCTIIIIK